ncbi:hypothetical protein CDAR_402131 [Caerostris darwini]|uniref:Uncharacterized protein n=1 Tax=Caerostris darwini TaxID=1538125 RepID=A0AAV4T3G8_9ARAC|nr:hypothetical protein CDAR_402131 [Caerostris darwini]
MEINVRVNFRHFISTPGYRGKTAEVSYCRPIQCFSEGISSLEFDDRFIFDRYVFMPSIVWGTSSLELAGWFIDRYHSSHHFHIFFIRISSFFLFSHLLSLHLKN